MRKKWWGLVTLVGLLLITLILMITGWAPNQPHHQKPIRVVTSLNFYGEVASEVAGKYGQTTSFINNSAVDPHDYQPSTKQALQLDRANVVIENGLGYDSWVAKMVTAASTKQTVINVGQQVAHRRAGDNEHVWYRPSTMSHLASLLARQYARIDPRHQSYYYGRARRYQQKLASLNQTIARARTNARHDKRQVLVSEPVFDYALGHLGYHIANPHFAKAIEDGNDPAAKDIAQMRTAIQQHRVAFFVENSQESNSTINNLVKLAHRNGVPVLKVTETKPAKLTYVQWMQREYQELIKIQER